MMAPSPPSGTLHDTASISQIITSLKNQTYSKSAIGEFSGIKSGKPFDEPIPSSGATSVTFRHDSDSKGSRALRFAHGLLPDKPYWDRLRQLSGIVESHSKSDNNPCIVEFDVIDGALEVNGKSMPVMIMPWIKGQNLTSYTRSLAMSSDANGLNLLAESLEEFGKSIQHSPFDHGDISGGNLMIGDDGRIHLIDPDTLRHLDVSDPPITELGHVTCSHPSRSGDTMEDDLFRFPLEVLIVSAMALSHQPNLVKKHGNEDSALFSEEDLRNPMKSSLFSLLVNHDDYELRVRATRLLDATKATSVDDANSILGPLYAPKPIPTVGLRIPQSPLRSFVAREKQKVKHSIGRGRLPLKIPDAMSRKEVE